MPLMSLLEQMSQWPCSFKCRKSTRPRKDDWIQVCNDHPPPMLWNTAKPKSFHQSVSRTNKRFPRADVTSKVNWSKVRKILGLWKAVKLDRTTSKIEFGPKHHKKVLKTIYFCIQVKKSLKSWKLHKTIFFQVWKFSLNLSQIIFTKPDFLPLFPKGMAW